VEQEIRRDDPYMFVFELEDGCALPSVELGSPDCVVPGVVNVYSESPADDATIETFVGKHGRTKCT
jgi:hypothetical protein